MAKGKGKKKKTAQLLEDRKVIGTLALGEPGWKIMEEAGAYSGEDPVQVALTALAREVIRTSTKVEYDVMPTLKFVGRVACGAPGLDPQELQEWEAELAETGR